MFFEPIINYLSTQCSIKLFSRGAGFRDIRDIIMFAAVTKKWHVLQNVLRMWAGRSLALVSWRWWGKEELWYLAHWDRRQSYKDGEVQHQLWWGLQQSWRDRSIPKLKKSNAHSRWHTTFVWIWLELEQLGIVNKTQLQPTTMGAICRSTCNDAGRASIALLMVWMILSTS